ncbi:MAG: dephospho-CoA kinase [Verrucomicrobia bacterium]|nr:dephospho-CoA kinase [Verrucomicrobiota bacterium]MBV8376969.1 dephospho-CoA kinase [Verrucomicrobiota bacterium]
MPCIGITGGVATGKSTVARQLHELLRRTVPVELFNSDFEARRLTNGDLVVQEEIKAAFGVQVFDSEGNLARDRLRDLAFRDRAARKILESILHPRIRKAWIDRAGGDGLLLAEIPLLYETGAEPYFDRIIVTACSRASQVERIVVERRLSKELAEQIIQAQMDLEEKIRRADWVVWTDCPPGITAQQVNLIFTEVTERYGGARR